MQGLELDEEQMSLLDRLSEDEGVSSTDSLFNNLPNLGARNENNANNREAVINPEEVQINEAEDSNVSMNSANEDFNNAS